MAARSLRGRSPRRAESGGGPAAIAAATSGIGTPQKGWLPVSPSQSITPTAQTSLRAVASLPSEPLGRDVGEGARDVADGCQRVRVVELREPEVEHADSHLVAFLEEDVGRLDVAVDDPAAVRVGEPVEDLGGRLHARGVVELGASHRLSQRPPADVLVRDVDVSLVTREVVGAHASLVAKSGRRLHLPHRARGALALARDDLQRDVEPGALVAREPHRARAATTERPKRSVAVEDERAVG